LKSKTKNGQKKNEEIKLNVGGAPLNSLIVTKNRHTKKKKPQKECEEVLLRRSKREIEKGGKQKSFGSRGQGDPKKDQEKDMAAKFSKRVTNNI